MAETGGSIPPEKYFPVDPSALWSLSLMRDLGGVGIRKVRIDFALKSTANTNSFGDAERLFSWLASQGRWGWQNATFQMLQRSGSALPTEEQAATMRRFAQVPQRPANSLYNQLWLAHAYDGFRAVVSLLYNAPTVPLEGACRRIFYILAYKEGCSQEFFNATVRDLNWKYP
jgi:hypothetical protein